MKNYKSKIKELLGSMTLREKIAQMSQSVAGYRCFMREGENFHFSNEFKDFVSEYGAMGAISNILRADGFTKHDWGQGIEPRHRIKVANQIQKYILDNAIHPIPTLIEVESNHGVQALGSTVFPTNLALGCSFNPEIYGKIMQSVGKEIELSGNQMGFVTMLDVARDPRWGRTEELFSEDPYLISKLTKAGVEGFKSDSNALICCKHYCAAGDCFGGINCNEVNVGIRELHDIHLPAAEAAVKAGADVFMAAYNTVDGIPCHVNSYLLRDVLREEFGFKGIVLSDGWAVPRVIKQMGDDTLTGVARVLKAGVDISLADAGTYLKLEDAVAEGKVSEKLIDEAVERILEKKFQMGLFDKPYVEEDNRLVAFLENGVQRDLAYESACESAVLLKNNGILPVSKDKRIALIGAHADNIYHQLGDYSPFVKKNLKTIKDAFDEGFSKTEFAFGWDFNGSREGFDEAIAVAENSDVIIVTIGGSSAKNISNTTYNATGSSVGFEEFIDCGEGIDVASIKLPGNQVEMVEALSELGKPIIAVLVAGRPYELTRISQLADAVIAVWYPGEEGAGALFDILVGKVNPSGKLSVSIPYSAGCLPAYYNRIVDSKIVAKKGWYENTYMDFPQRILYPFGYGLSYSEFEYKSISVTEKGDNAFEVSVTVENVSDVKGKETVQLYIHGYGNSVRRRIKELKGFKKVDIAPHSSVEVKFTLGYDELKIFSANNKYELENGKVDILVGSGDNLPLTAEVEVKY